MAITKKDITLKISQSLGFKQTDVKKIVQKFLDSIIDALAEGSTIELRNFGVFKVKTRRARVGRNPRTGDTVPVPPKKAAIFKSGRIMKKRLSS
jgi:nucleoid DNA-binding protein